MEVTQYQTDVPVTGLVPLSVMITIVSGARHLDNCISNLLAQEEFDVEKIEVIVPFDERDQEIPKLAQKFPNVVFYPMRMSVSAPSGVCHEHFDELRSAGLMKAKGKIIALMEDHEKPDKYWCRNIMESHQLPYAAIGGAVENAIDKSINWATYFFDFGRYQNPVIKGPSNYLTDINVSYKREALYKIKHVWENGFHEPDVHSALLANGETLWLTPDIVVCQDRFGLTLSQLLKEKFVWGRYFSGKRVEQSGFIARMIFCVISLAVPAIIFTKMTVTSLRKRRLFGKYIKALPVNILLIMFWYFGEFTGYFTGKKSRFIPA